MGSRSSLLSGVVAKENRRATAARINVASIIANRFPMQMRGLIGQPARFSYQTEENYTIIYYCPVTGCDETSTTPVARTQIPVPGVSPERPYYARRD